ncbi:MAG: biotin/lipoyl-containing protein, partial [Pseudomonadota bacterium]
LDLVALQIAVAEGRALPLTQDDVQLTGHAIEVRLYTEDPGNDFMPSTGRVLHWAPPEGEGIRVDDGIETGSDVSPFYDAMVAKIIAKGDTRAEALRRLLAALESTAFFGPATNRDFLIDALSQPAFAVGAATTAFIAETYGDEGFQKDAPRLEIFAAAIALDAAARQNTAFGDAIAVHPDLRGWSSTHDLATSAEYACGDQIETALTSPTQAGVRVDFGETAVEVATARNDSHRAELLIQGEAAVMAYHLDEDRIHIASARETRLIENLSLRLRSNDEESGGGTVLSPMHGKLLEIMVARGDAVTKGQKLAILEAMKMQHEIIAEIDGTVELIAATVGEQIAADELILEITTDEGE